MCHINWLKQIGKYFYHLDTKNETVNVLCTNTPYCAVWRCDKRHKLDGLAELLVKKQLRHVLCAETLQLA